MDLKSELLKSIWYAFTSLDVEQSGKVSKSQLKVLSLALYTSLNIPHDAATLEEHFQDNDNGPVSNQGYMPYLNKYILAKAKEGTFNKETFDDLCWMMTSKKNYRPSVEDGLCSQGGCFKLFCLFNLLSEDRYPLIIIYPEMEYLLKKISTAMSQEWDVAPLEDALAQDASLHEGMSVWAFLEHMNTGRLMRVDRVEAFSLALDEVFMEMYHNVLKKGYVLKRGHMRRNWHERWFVLKPCSMAYYVGEDQKEKKGEITLDGSCVVETIPDKEGKRCLFCVRTPGKTYEISASDQKQRVEWLQAVQTALRLTHEGKSSLHQELKLRRREQRESSQSSPAEEPGVQEQQGEVERQELEIESIIQHQREVEAQRKAEEEQEKEQQKEMQRELERQLEEAQQARDGMVAEMAQLKKEVEQQKKRIQELEVTQQIMETALNNEIQAHCEEESARLELERLLKEEQKKLQLLLGEQEAPPESTQKTPEQEEHTILSTTTSTSSQEPETLTETTQERSHQNPEYKVQENTSHFVTHYAKQWNVQLNRLMKPITPADKMEHLPVKPSCPKRGQALTSTEFITKCQSAVSQETPLPKSQLPNKEEEGLPDQLETVNLSEAEGSQA